MLPRTITVDSEDRRQHAIKVLSLVAIDPPIDVSISPHHDQRSLSQNARLWKLHTLAAEVTGYSPEDMHEFALCRYFGFVDQELNGIARRVPLKRSSTRDKKEFGAFMEATEAWYITEFNVWLEQ